MNVENELHRGYHEQEVEETDHRVRGDLAEHQAQRPDRRDHHLI